MSKKYLSIALALLAGLATAVSAQPWEEVYGEKAHADEGHRRVTPVTQCPGRGYIAIGTRYLNNFPGVYVVRTDNSGATMWERFYDVGNDGERDEGYALVELKDGSGFATTGSSYRGGQWHADFMRINCDGKDPRAKFYVVHTGDYYRLVGHDIREAVSGDGVITQAGDLLIAGYVEDINWRADAVLLRVDRGGNLIWHRRYDTGANERFYGLTETKPTYAATGDIAAVGDWWTDFATNNQALVARVDGQNGGLSGSPDQCMALYGDRGGEDFQSIVETKTCPDTGNLTMAGLSTSPGLNDDVYVVQTTPNPCTPLAQVTIGNETGDPFKERATDLIEVLYPVHPGLGVPVGAFALTGSVETKYSDADAFLLFVKPTSLGPLAARRYGDHGSSVDIGTSLQQNAPFGPQDPGFIIAGTSYFDWEGSGDQQDLYLIHPNDGAKTGCQQDWVPDSKEQDWKPRQQDPHIDKVVSQVDVEVKGGEQDTLFQFCH